MKTMISRDIKQPLDNIIEVILFVLIALKKHRKGCCSKAIC